MISFLCPSHKVNLLWMESEQLPLSKKTLYELPPCSICLEDLHENVVALRKCGHCFHKDCITGVRQPYCPMCKKYLSIDTPLEIYFQTVKDKQRSSEIQAFIEKKMTSQRIPLQNQIRDKNLVIRALKIDNENSIKDIRESAAEQAFALQKQNSKLESQIRILNDEFQMLQQLEMSRSKEEERIKIEMEALQAKVNSYEDLETTLKSEKYELNQQIKSLSEKEVSIAIENKILKEKVDVLSSQLHSMRNLQKEIEEIKAKNLQQKQMSFKDWHEKLNKSYKDSSDLFAKYSDCLQEKQKYQQQKTELQRQLMMLKQKSEIQEVQKTLILIKELNDQRQKMLSQIKQLQQNKKFLLGERQGMHSQINQLQQNKKCLQNEKQNMLSQMKQLQENKNSLLGERQEQIKQLQYNKKCLLGEKQEMVSQIKQTQENKQCLLDEINVLDNKVKNLIGESLRKEDVIRAEYTKLKKEKQESEIISKIEFAKRLKLEREDAQSLRVKVQECQTQKIELHNEIKKLTFTIEVLQQNQKNYKDELLEAQQREIKLLEEIKWLKRMQDDKNQKKTSFHNEKVRCEVPKKNSSKENEKILANIIEKQKANSCIWKDEKNEISVKYRLSSSRQVPKSLQQIYGTKNNKSRDQWTNGNLSRTSGSIKKLKSNYY